MATRLSETAGHSYYDGRRALIYCSCPADQVVPIDMRDGLGPRDLMCGRSLALRVRREKKRAR